MYGSAMTKHGELVKRPTWVIIMRAAGLIAIIACVVALVGMGMQSLAMLQVGTVLLLVAAGVVVVNVIVLIASRPKRV